MVAFRSAKEFVHESLALFRRPKGDHQKAFPLSSINVTGPSFTSETCICVRKRPQPTLMPPSRTTKTKCSYRRSASSGSAAATKLGRRPFRQSPNSVNWLTTSIPPPTSANERFIFPSGSSKIRSPAIFSAKYFALASSSPCSTPSKTTRPSPIWPVTSPSTVTLASETRCTTARNGSTPQEAHARAAHVSLLRLRLQSVLSCDEGWSLAR